jgi:hypothetical protein
MTSPSLRPIRSCFTTPPPPPPLQLSPKPLKSPKSSPRQVAGCDASESAFIRYVVGEWKDGNLDIDGAVSGLLQPARRRKSFAKEVYNRFVEQVVAVPDSNTLVGSRKALYAASVFANYADCAQDFEEVDKSFSLSEKSFKVRFPEIYAS